MNANTPLSKLAYEMVEPRSYVNAVGRLSKCIGRKAVLGDLNLATWQQFENWLASQSYAVKSQADARHRLRVLWAMAYEDGHAPELPAKRSRPRGYARRGRGRGPVPFTGEGEPLPERSLEGFYRNYYLPLKLRSRAENTRRLYGYTVRNFSAHLGRHATLDDLTDAAVSGLLIWCKDRGLSPHSVEKERSQLLAIWRAACRKKYVEHWPDVQPERLPVRTPMAWTKEDLAKLWGAVKATQGEIAGIPAADWWSALILVFMCSAERVSAVIGLRWDDVDLASGWINFRAETRKGGRADSSRRLNADAVAALKRIREPARELVFEWDRARTYLWAKFAEILKAAGLPTDAKSKFHRLRKTTASFYEAAGGNAQTLLGHSHRKTTQAYLDPRICRPQQPVDLLGDLLGAG